LLKSCCVGGMWEVVPLVFESVGSLLGGHVDTSAVLLRLLSSSPHVSVASFEAKFCFATSSLVVVFDFFSDSPALDSDRPSVSAAFADGMTSSSSVPVPSLILISSSSSSALGSLSKTSMHPVEEEAQEHNQLVSEGSLFLWLSSPARFYLCASCLEPLFRAFASSSWLVVHGFSLLLVLFSVSVPPPPSREVCLLRVQGASDSITDSAVR
ncbi:hypothetical protein KCV03_g69, partial [Aureobasidium melanogenum]